MTLCILEIEDCIARRHSKEDYMHDQNAGF